MVGSRFRWLSGFAAALFLGLGTLEAQTVIWTGTSSNQDLENGANYSGGVPPDTSGADTFEFSSGAGSTINVSTAADLYGIYLPGPDAYFYLNQVGSGSLSLGAGGISLGSGAGPIVFIQVPVTLTANQTWDGSTSGFIFQNGVISGSHSLTIDGRVYLFGNNTFSGGLEVANGATMYVGNNSAAGTGTLTVDDGATLTTWEGSAYVLPNTTTFGGSATLTTDTPSDTLGFSGTVTETTSGSTLTIGTASAILLDGNLAGPANSTLTIAGTSAQLAVDGGSQAVLTSVTGVNTLHVKQAQVILNPTAAPGTAFASIGNSNLTIQNGGYLGLSGSFTNTGAVSTFLYDINSLGSTIYGSIGLDSYGSGTTNTFTDAIDLSTFTSTNFLGLGSATSAILYGTVSESGSSGYYKFGGGGGSLILVSSLNDSGVSLIMEAAAAPLTLELRGNNNSYSGDTEVYGGALIFDSTIYSANGQFRMNGGYIGEVPSASGKSVAQFLSLFSTPFQYGVIGFDNDNGTTVQLSDDINLSAFTQGMVFLGSSTSAELSGILTPPPSGFAFTGVKGGTLQVDSDLGGSSGLTIGLTSPMESNGSQSTVILTGDNSMLTGPVTFNSGILILAQGSGLGSGDVTVPDLYGSNYSPLPPTLEEQGENITVPNNFIINALSGNPGLVVGNPSGEATLTLSGIISDGSSGSGILGIGGNVALTGINTYSGGTFLQGANNPTIYVNNSASFGASSGIVQINDSATIVPLSNVTIPNPIKFKYNNTTLTLGSGGSEYTLTLTGAITGDGPLTIVSSVDLPNPNSGFSGSVFIQDAIVTIGDQLSLGTGALTLSGGQVQYGFTNPTIENLTGDLNSSIALESGSTLTLDATNASTNYYEGTITGDSETSVVKTGTGAEYLGYSTNTWGGGTTVAAGTLIAGNSNSLGTGTVTVNSGAVLQTDTYATLQNTLSLQDGATIGGSGTFAPAATITLANGTTIQPGSFAFGNGIGMLGIGSSGLTLGGGGIYAFNIATASGVAGTDYSSVTVAGTVDILANPTSPFTISLVSVNPATGQQGTAVFSSSTPYSWTILSATQINYFSAADFNFSSTSFQNGLGGGYLTIAQQGNSLVVDFTPVPEPATWALIGGGTLLAGWVTIRRRRRT